MAHCLITGCRLFVRHGMRSVWGDLHGCCDDTILVFQGNRLDGKVAWDCNLQWEESEKAVMVNTDDYVERLGIFTFSSGAATFSKAAKERMSYGKRPE